MKPANVVLGLTIVLAAGAVGSASYSPPLTISRLAVRNDGYVLIGFTPQPSGTCTHYEFHMAFNSDSAGGKNLLSTLLAAKLAGRMVDVWYDDTTAPGTQDAACAIDRMARLTMVGFYH